MAKNKSIGAGKRSLDVELSAIQRLRKDLKTKAKTLSKDEARFLVDSYYIIQEYRKRAFNQIRALEESGEPHEVIIWLAANNEALEKDIQKALDAFSKADPLGQWCHSIIGIGPVITAGLLAHIDLNKAKTAGAIWNYAGLNPDVVWGKGEKRPWNDSLKTLCWKIGESFMKQSGNENSYYGKLYIERKEIEIRNSLAGKHRKQAEAKAKFYKNAEVKAWYAGCYKKTDVASLVAEGIAPIDWVKTLKKRKQKLEAGVGDPMLSPGHLTSRAKRWVVKLFLSHYHGEGYKRILGKNPPKPYPIAFLDHVHEHEAPNAAAPVVEKAAV